MEELNEYSHFSRIDHAYLAKRPGSKTVVSEFHQANHAFALALNLLKGEGQMWKVFTGVQVS